MTQAEIRREIDRKLETVPNQLFATVEEVQPELYNAIKSLVESLDTVDGNVIANRANLLKIQQIDTIVAVVLFEGQYQQGLIKYASQFLEQGSLINDYFKSVRASYEPKPVYNQVLRQASSDAIDKLTQDGIDPVFTKPLKELLNRSIYSGAKQRDVIESIGQFIEGNDQVEGKLNRYVKQIGRDAFSAADRQLTYYIAEDLGMEFYLYAGDTVKDSRKFCLARAGKYFHRREIQDWVTQEWQGKAPVNDGTIFIWLGGYNCLHTALPVEVSQVPKDVIERNINKGYYEQ